MKTFLKHIRLCVHYAFLTSQKMMTWFSLILNSEEISKNYCLSLECTNLYVKTPMKQRGKYANTHLSSIS